MDVADFDFDLPEALIAQRPANRRDDSRLLVVDREKGTLHHSHFNEVADWLASDDLVVVNDSRVFPARLIGRFVDTGGRIESLLLRQVGDTRWQVLVRPGRRCRAGRRIVFPGGREATVVDSGTEGPTRTLDFDASDGFFDWLDEAGEVPLPPYISRPATAGDRDRYQTLYARERGSVAAPTAGLHFTETILEKLNVCRITLHVGYGTFKPITTSRLEDHRMDLESYSISVRAASRISEQLALERRVVAVGTTTTRALEHAAEVDGTVRAGNSAADLFIYPGFAFRVVGGLLTNFHLPRSTLLLLVSAFAGRELIREAYEEAIRHRYRFYSYGDAMLIL